MPPKRTAIACRQGKGGDLSLDFVNVDNLNLTLHIRNHFDCCTKREHKDKRFICFGGPPRNVNAERRSCTRETNKPMGGQGTGHQQGCRGGMSALALRMQIASCAVELYDWPRCCTVYLNLCAHVYFFLGLRRPTAAGCT